MRIRLQPVRGIGEAGLAEHVDHAFAQAVRGDASMQRDRLGDLAADAVQRVEAVHRLLEDHARQLAARPVQRLGIGADHLLVVQHDAAGRIAAARRQKLQQRQRGDRLAGTGFADQRQGLATVQA